MASDIGLANLYRFVLWSLAGWVDHFDNCCELLAERPGGCRWHCSRFYLDRAPKEMS